MLSIQKCRELIPDSEQLTDKEIEEIRADLYGMAELAWDVWLYRKKMSYPKGND